MIFPRTKPEPKNAKRSQTSAKTYHIRIIIWNRS